MNAVVFEILQDGNYFILKTSNLHYKHLNDKCCKSLLFSAMENIADVMNNYYNKNVCFVVG